MGCVCDANRAEIHNHRNVIVWNWHFKTILEIIANFYRICVKATVNCDQNEVGPVSDKMGTNKACFINLLIIIHIFVHICTYSHKFITGSASLFTKCFLFLTASICRARA